MNDRDIKVESYTCNISRSEIDYVTSVPKTITEKFGLIVNLHSCKLRSN